MAHERNLLDKYNFGNNLAVTSALKISGSVTAIAFFLGQEDAFNRAIVIDTERFLFFLVKSVCQYLTNITEHAYPFIERHICIYIYMHCTDSDTLEAESRRRRIHARRVDIRIRIREFACVAECGRV